MKEGKCASVKEDVRVGVRPHVKVSVVLGRKEVCGLIDVFVGMSE